MLLECKNKCYKLNYYWYIYYVCEVIFYVGVKDEGDIFFFFVCLYILIVCNLFVFVEWCFIVLGY